MKILKWILIVILILAGIFIVYSLSRPDQVKVEESIVINAKPKTVYKKLIDMRSWEDWSDWDRMDPNMMNEYSENQGEVGAWNEWKSKNPQVGNGRQEIVELRKNEYIKGKLNFEFMEGDNFAEFILKPVEEGTEVTWTFEGSKLPFTYKWMHGMIESGLHENYQSSLERLKTVIESEPISYAIPEGIELVELDKRMIISIKDSTDSRSISDKLTELYTELSIFDEMNEGIKVNDMPIAMYYFYSEEKVILEAALPVEGEVENSGRITYKALPSGEALKGTHYGDYELTGKMHDLIEKTAQYNELDLGDVCWEIYANDPTTVDSASVETHVIYPLQ